MKLQCPTITTAVERLIFRKANGRDGMSAGLKMQETKDSTDNSAVNLFLQMGFVEEYRTPEIIMVKKRLLHM